MDSLTMVILFSIGFITMLLILSAQIIIIRGLLQLKKDLDESRFLLLTQGETQMNVIKGRFQAIIKTIGFLANNKNGNTSEN